MAGLEAKKDELPERSFRTAEVLRSLSLGTDLAVGLTPEHSARACYMGMRVAREMELSSDEQADLFYAELIVEAGCTAWSSEFTSLFHSDDIAARRDYAFYTDPRNRKEVMGWMVRYLAPGAPLHSRLLVGLDVMTRRRGVANESLRNTAEVARRFAERLGMSERTQTVLRYKAEQWDGRGPHGLSGPEIPLLSRIMYGSHIFTAAHAMQGREAASRVAKKRRGTAFDPAVADTMTELSERPEFWDALEEDAVWDVLLPLEPESAYRYTSPERLEDVALSFADFADMKSPVTAGHSRRVAETAERIATGMGLSSKEVRDVHMAALAHDLGMVMIPVLILEKPAERLTAVEREQLRLHPYQAERVLSIGSVWQAIAPTVGAHHERFDGTGYYRGLSGSQIPLGARIIAVADRYDELTGGAPGTTPVAPKAAMQVMVGEAGSSLCPETVEALREQIDPLADVRLQRARQRLWPQGLTDREVEVLRLAARGLSRRQIGDTLFVTEGTVRSHLEHIYGKIGVSTRAAATLFTIEHDLLD